jgi:hypothetical protein
MPIGATTLKGRYKVTVYGPGGSVKDARPWSQNVVCTNGKEWLANFLHSSALAAATNTARYLAVGTGTGSESASDTALGTEVSRHTGTVSYVSNQIYQVTATFATNSATGAIVEYGLLSSNSAGTLISRDVESVINVGASDTLEVVYQLTVS